MTILIDGNCTGIVTTIDPGKKKTDSANNTNYKKLIN